MAAAFEALGLKRPVPQELSSFAMPFACAAWFFSLGDREQELIYLFCKRAEKNNKPLHQLVVDVHPSLNFASSSDYGVCTRLTEDAQPWVQEMGRVMLGEEGLLLQGVTEADMHRANPRCNGLVDIQIKTRSIPNQQ